MTHCVGVDVAKNTLMGWWDAQAYEFKNTKTEIRRFLKKLPKEALIGIETTSDYHFLIAEEAIAAGFTVFALNPLDCARYRMALRGRSKTDRIDAEMIARFVEKEHDSMRPFTLLPDEIRRLRQLLRRRDQVVRSRAGMVQSLGSDPQIKKLAAPALKKLGELIATLERMIGEAMEGIEGHDVIASIPAVGALNTACSLCALSVGDFKSADAFVAYAGLDCRARESGTFVGRRVISRRGDRLMRKLLFLAAMSGCVHPAWKPTYDRHLAKGMSKTQALVALARKIARTIWSVYTHRTTFEGARVCSQKIMHTP